VAGPGTLAFLHWSDKPLTCDAYNGGECGYQAVQLEFPPASQNVGTFDIGPQVKVKAIVDDCDSLEEITVEAGSIETTVFSDSCISATISGTDGQSWPDVNGAVFAEVSCE
jgi:hypothetical protein